MGNDFGFVNKDELRLLAAGGTIPHLPRGVLGSGRGAGPEPDDDDDEQNAPYVEPGTDPLPGEPATCLAAHRAALVGPDLDILGIISRPRVFLWTLG